MSHNQAFLNLHEDINDDQAHKRGGAPQSRSLLFIMKYYSCILPIFTILCILVLALLLSTIILSLKGPTISNEECVEQKCENQSIYGANGVVATTHHVATDAGLSILAAGGNAIDAAIAIQFMLGVVQPQSTGIGGGTIIMIYNATTKSIHSLDAREESPELFGASEFCDPPCSSCNCTNSIPFDDRCTGGHPVGIPGVVAAMERLYEEHRSGKLTLQQLLQPAIDRARNGIVMDIEMNYRLTVNYERMKLFNSTAKLYFPNDHIPEVGEVWYNPDLANTYQYLIDNGLRSFYTGILGDEIISAVQTNINPHTNRISPMKKEDLINYKAVYRQPLNISYRSNYTIYSFPPPSSGGISINSMLKHYEYFEFSYIKQNNAEFLQTFIDIQDLVFSDRNQYLADEDFINIPKNGLINNTYIKGRIEQWMNKLNSAMSKGKEGIVEFGYPPWDQDIYPSTSDTPSPAHPQYASSPPIPKSGTTHFVISDVWGNIVSMTTTIEENFGSGVVVPNRGFLLNNELTDFQPLPIDSLTSLPYANGPESGWKLRRTALPPDDQTSGGKRPMSSMTPLIIFKNSQPYAALGSPGGSRIIGTVLNSLINLLDFNMCLGDSIATPRVISRNIPNDTEVEWAMLYDSKYNTAMDILRSRGYPIQPLVTKRPLGYVQGLIVAENGGWYGEADQRLSTASAAGY